MRCIREKFRTIKHTETVYSLGHCGKYIHRLMQNSRMCAKMWMRVFRQMPQFSTDTAPPTERGWTGKKISLVIVSSPDHVHYGVCARKNNSHFCDEPSSLGEKMTGQLESLKREFSLGECVLHPCLPYIWRSIIQNTVSFPSLQFLLDELKKRSV